MNSRLLEIVRHKVVKAASWAGITCKQSCATEGNTLRGKTGCAHAKQFKRLRKTVKRQRTIPGAVICKLQCKLVADQAAVACKRRPGDRAADRLCEV